MLRELHQLLDELHDGLNAFRRAPLAQSGASP